jgi:hypothetical protein
LGITPALSNKKNIVIVEDRSVMRRGLAAWFAETEVWNLARRGLITEAETVTGKIDMVTVT